MADCVRAQTALMGLLLLINGCRLEMKWGGGGGGSCMQSEYPGKVEGTAE